MSDKFYLSGFVAFLRVEFVEGVWVREIGSVVGVCCIFSEFSGFNFLNFRLLEF